MRRIRWQAILLALFVSGQLVAAMGATPVEFSSGDRRVALIELFTSEGCSSCPPADRWLSSLKTNPDLWKRFAPVAFHVDYWDYIGWQDRFARAEYSDRQRRYAAEGGSRSVYTPGIFTDGRAWLGWRSAGSISYASVTVGDLRLRVEGRDVAVRFDPTAVDDSELMLHIVVLGMNLESRVRAGENKGRTLRHDFAALGMISLPFERVNGSYRAITRLPATASQSRHRALVAWVSTIDAQVPIQSVGGFLPSE
jgi:hypothetical protein